jgi:serine/threonine protein kinase
MKEQFSKYLKENKNKIQLSVGEINLIDKIGEGGNGIVYRGEIFGKTFAFKFLLSNASGKSLKTKSERFLAEYFNIVTIEKTNFIVKYVDYDLLIINDEKGSTTIPVIMMKEYESSLIFDESENKGQNFIKLFHFLLDAVEEIHSQGIIHRDLKPENILVKNGKYVLADFGIASYNPEIFEIRAKTVKSERIGNRLFSAPEQEIAGIESHPTMDIYAIGQILQWFATGTTHRGTGRKRISLKIEDEQLYNAIIENCLKNEAKQRFQSIADIKQYIKDSREKDVFEYMYDFNRVVRSNFPKNTGGFVHSNDLERIDGLFQKFKDSEQLFDNKLWWHDGSGNIEFKLTKKDLATWKFGDSEYSIKEIWIFYDSSVFNDFILVHHNKSEPFIVSGEETFYTAIVDDKHHISYSEHQNGFAEIDGKVVDLEDHKVEFIERAKDDGYFFIGLTYHCILRQRNDETVRKIIENLKAKDGNIDIEALKEFQWKIRKNKLTEVLMRL